VIDLCRHLRWKSHARDSEDPHEIRESAARSRVPFSCLKTCRPWGPDDELAAPELCCSDRACFDADRVARDADIA
jgi:hypothetical protein